MTGYTYSSDFPIHNPYDGIYNGGVDAFVTRLCAGEDIGFRPNPNGWKFNNSPGNMWPYGWWPWNPWDERCTCGINLLARCFPTWELLTGVFGSGQTEFPDGRRRPAAEERWKSLKNCWGGSCFGFAVSSFLFFDGYRDVGTAFPGYSNLYSIPINEDSRWIVNTYFFYQFGEETQQHRNSQWNTVTPSQTLQVCRDMLNSSTRNDRVLSFWNTGKGGGGHTVNPYRCEQDQSDPNTWYIYIYDNNFPNDDTKRIEVNTNTNTWSYSVWPTWGGSKWLLLELPASDFTTNPTLPKSIPPRERWTTGSVQSTINAQSYLEFYNSDADTVLLSSSLGMIGFIDDSLHSTLSDGMPIIPTTGEETQPFGYYLPSAVWSCQFAGLRDSTSKLALFTDSTVFKYSRSGADSSQHENIRYGDNKSSMLIRNPDDSSRSYNFDAICVTVDSEIYYSVKDISIGHEDSATYSVRTGSALQIDNYGATKTCDLRVEIADLSRDTVFFKKGITLDSNTSQLILPDWRMHGDSLMVLVDRGMVGIFSDTAFIENEGEYIRGDANRDKKITVGDVVYLVNYLFKHGPAPIGGLWVGDANCDGKVNIADIVYLVAYLFKQGPQPCL